MVDDNQETSDEVRKPHVGVNYNSPVFDPIFERADENYYPANESTMLLVLIRQIYRDVERLCSYIRETTDDYGRKLLTKYAIVEFTELDNHLKQLFDGVLAGKTGYPLDDVQRQSVEAQKRIYNRSSQPLREKFAPIRNKMGAHRDAVVHLRRVAEYWDSLNVQELLEACRYAASAFNFLKSLPVHTWTKIGKDEQGREIFAYISPFRFTESPEIP